MTACAAPAPIRIPTDPPPADLAAACWTGPPWPEGEASLGEFVAIAEQREIANADCRNRQARLVRAWPQ